MLYYKITVFSFQCNTHNSTHCKFLSCINHGTDRNRKCCQLYFLFFRFWEGSVFAQACSSDLSLSASFQQTSKLKFKNISNTLYHLFINSIRMVLGCLIMDISTDVHVASITESGFKFQTVTTVTIVKQPRPRTYLIISVLV